MRNIRVNALPNRLTPIVSGARPNLPERQLVHVYSKVKEIEIIESVIETKLEGMLFDPFNRDFKKTKE